MGGEFKELTGTDYQPPAQPKKNSQEKKENTPPASTAPTVTLSPEAEKVKEKIVQQGDKIRQMKQDKVGMDKLKPEIDALLKFKGEFKEITGTDYQAPGANPKKNSKEKKEEQKKQPQKQQPQKQQQKKKKNTPKNNTPKKKKKKKKK